MRGGWGVQGGDKQSKHRTQVYRLPLCENMTPFRAPLQNVVTQASRISHDDIRNCTCCMHSSVAAYSPSFVRELWIYRTKTRNT